MSLNYRWYDQTVVRLLSEIKPVVTNHDLCTKCCWANCLNAPYLDQNVIELHVYDCYIQKYCRSIWETLTTMAVWRNSNNSTDVSDDNKLGCQLAPSVGNLRQTSQNVQAQSNRAYSIDNDEKLHGRIAYASAPDVKLKKIISAEGPQIKETTLFQRQWWRKCQ